MLPVVNTNIPGTSGRPWAQSNHFISRFVCLFNGFRIKHEACISRWIWESFLGETNCSYNATSSSDFRGGGILIPPPPPNRFPSLQVQKIALSTHINNNTLSKCKHFSQHGTQTIKHFQYSEKVHLECFISFTQSPELLPFLWTGGENSKNTQNKK